MKRPKTILLTFIIVLYSMQTVAADEFVPSALGVEMQGTDQQKNVEFVSKMYMEDMTGITCVYETRLYTTGAIVQLNKNTYLECETKLSPMGGHVTKWVRKKD